jgi:hypothetical protein
MKIPWIVLLLYFNSELLLDGLTECVCEFAMARHSTPFACRRVLIDVVFAPMPVKRASLSLYFSDEVTSLQTAISTWVVLNFLTGTWAFQVCRLAFNS